MRPQNILFQRLRQNLGKYFLFLKSNVVTVLMFRVCDSHNLNVSPFCTLVEGLGPMKWAENLRNLYEEENSFLPSYIENLESPIRMTYPSEALKEMELMSTLAKVLVNFFHSKSQSHM